MVKGLEVFREHFRNYADRYVLIGGAACDIAMTAAGLAFRATKDLDIVLYVEALDAAFVQAFWEFVRMGGYEVQEKSTGEKQFYRFQKPTNADYPFMLELFSRQPDVLQVADGSHLTPLPVEEDASSLSAILLDNDYRHCRSRRSSGDSAWGLAECFRAPPRHAGGAARRQVSRSLPDRAEGYRHLGDAVRESPHRGCVARSNASAGSWCEASPDSPSHLRRRARPGECRLRR